MKKPGTTRRKLTHNTIQIVDDRLAKIAATYTNGFCRVHYVADKVCTDVKGNIFLPISMQNLTNENSELAWSFVSHEMGHQGVENDLKVFRKTRRKAILASSLYNLIPAEIRELGVEHGTKKFPLSSEVLAKLEDYAYVIVAAFGGSRWAAAKQLQTLVNVFEDPRQEAQVSARWAGSAVYLEKGGEVAFSKWTKKAKELVALGQTKSFDIFAIGLLFDIAGKEIDLGPEVAAQVEACRDVIELFKAEADWRGSFGFLDSLNAALVALSRV